MFQMMSEQCFERNKKNSSSIIATQYTHIKEYESQRISLKMQIWKRYILYLELTHWVFIFEKIEHTSINRKYSYPALSTYDIYIRHTAIYFRASCAPQNESSLKIRARADLHVCPLLSPWVLVSLFSLFSFLFSPFPFLFSLIRDKCPRLIPPLAKEIRHGQRRGLTTSNSVSRIDMAQRK